MIAQRRRANLRTLLVVACLLVFGASSQAATIIWDNHGGDSLLANPLNWIGDIAPTADDDVIFNSIGGTTLKVTGEMSFHNMTFDGDASAFTFVDDGGGTGKLVLNAGTGTTNTMNNSPNSQTFNLPTAVGRQNLVAAGGDFVFNAPLDIGNGRLTLAFITMLGDHDFHVNQGLVGIQAPILLKDGIGTLHLKGGPEEWPGLFTIQNGFVEVSNNTGLTHPDGWTNPWGVPGSTGAIVLTNNITLDTFVYMGTREVDDKPQLINKSGTNTMTNTLAAFVDDAANLNVAIQSDAGLLKITGNVTQPNLGAFALTLRGAGNGDISGAIAEGDSSSTWSLAKKDAGTWTISGANVYTGTTTVSGGTLLVNSTAGTGLTTVETGGALGGTGTVPAEVVVNEGGTLAPGASIGTLAVTGAVTINGKLAVEGSGASIDKLAVTNSLTLSATSVLDVLGTLNGATTYVIATYNAGGLTGTFGNALAATSKGYNVVYENSQIVLDELDGDANRDGVVNIFDINLVSSNWNPTGPVNAFAPGNVNHDLVVNIFDINSISSNWNHTATNGGPAHAHAVPEPTTFGLLALGSALIAARVFSSRRQRTGR